MQLSSYMKIFPDDDHPERRLVFSTRTAAVASVSVLTLRSIENGNFPARIENQLTRLGFLTSNPEQERQSVLGFFDRFNAGSKTLSIMVLLNLDCNFACPYCFEGEMKGNLYMSDQTAENLVEFAREKFDSDKQHLVVDFYGGEPLLSPRLLRHLVREFRSLAESRGGTFRFNLVTNGSLLTRKMADSLVPLGLQSVKITLDGPAEIHNRYRPFKTGAGSFETLLANIRAVSDQVTVRIGGNYLESTFKTFPDLLDELVRQGITPDTVHSVKFDPVVNDPDGNPSGSGCHLGCTSPHEPWVDQASMYLREEILKRGYNTSKPATVACLVEKRDAFVVNFNGDVYKCPAFVGKPDFCIGNIESGVNGAADSYRLGVWKNDTCKACEYLPLCMGGCRYMTYLNNRCIEKPDCKREHFDTVLESYIKQDLRYRPAQRLR